MHNTESYYYLSAHNKAFHLLQAGISSHLVGFPYRLALVLGFGYRIQHFDDGGIGIFDDYL